MSEDKKACSDTRCPMTRGGVCNVCGADVPKGFGEPSLHHELVAALEKFTAHYEPWMGEMGGHHDDVECIVHSRHTFGDLRRARAALQKAKQGDKK